MSTINGSLAGDMQDSVGFGWALLQRLYRLGCWKHEQFDLPALGFDWASGANPSGFGTTQSFWSPSALQLKQFWNVLLSERTGTSGKLSRTPYAYISSVPRAFAAPPNDKLT
jgi:hypothetical protein